MISFDRLKIRFKSFRLNAELPSALRMDLNVSRCSSTSVVVYFSRISKHLLEFLDCPSREIKGYDKTIDKADGYGLVPPGKDSVGGEMPGKV